MRLELTYMVLDLNDVRSELTREKSYLKSHKVIQDNQNQVGVSGNGFDPG